MTVSRGSCSSLAPLIGREMRERRPRGMLASMMKPPCVTQRTRNRSEEAPSFDVETKVLPSLRRVICARGG